MSKLRARELQKYLLCTRNTTHALGWSMRVLKKSHGTASVLARDVARNLAAIGTFTNIGEHVDLVLQPALTIAGSLKDTDGKPIRGAHVFFRCISGGRYATLDPPAVTSDERGQFAISTLPRGQTYIIADILADGFGSSGTNIAATETQTGFCRVPPLVLLKTDRVLAGKVVDSHGKAVSGATVRFENGRRPRGTERNAWSSSITDAQGRFEFDEVCEGRVQITANKSSERSGNGPESFFQAGDTNILIRFEGTGVKP